MFGKQELDTELSWEEFRDKYLNGEMSGWIGKTRRPLRMWLHSLQRYAAGDH